jgi:hypothetical protein
LNSCVLLRDRVVYWPVVSLDWLSS